jgi:hypothetical protein
VASVVDRATAKDPRDRYPSVGEMVRDLEATLEVEASRGGGTTGEATTVLRSVRRRRGLWPSRMSSAGIAMGIVGLALIGAALLLGSGPLEKIGSDGNGATASAIALARDSADDFDPYGDDGEEHADEADRVVDDNPTTAWSTETYQGGFGDKPGVGVYVDAKKAVDVSAVELRLGSDTRGADIEIRSAPGATDPPEDLEEWRLIGSVQGTGTRETIEVDNPRPSTFYLVWITTLPPSGQAEISEIRLVES